MPKEGSIPNTWKKTSHKGFYSKFLRVDPRGKSSLVKTEMIKDLQRNVNYQLSRQKKLKYVIQKIKEYYQYKNSLKQTKIRRRDANLEERRIENKELEKEIAKREREILKLVAKVDEKDGVISDLKEDLLTEGSREFYLKEIEKWKSERDKYYDKCQKLYAKKVYKPVKKVIVEKQELSTEEKRIKAYFENGINKEKIDFIRIVEKVIEYADVKNFHLKSLRALVRLYTYGKLSRKDVGITQKYMLSLASEGYVHSDNIGMINARRIYFLTPKGIALVEDYNNFIKKDKLQII